MSAPANAAQTPSKLRQATVERVQQFLETLQLPEGAALVATGSLARQEMTPKSDLDLMLLHTGDTASIPEDFWYPIWDAGWKLDCAVRTPDECVAMMQSEVTAALSQLEMRHIAGNRELVDTTKRAVFAAWRRELPRRFDQVVDTAIARWRRSGSVVAMTHPDLKHGRGGLRDVELLKALALGNLCDAPPLDEQHRLLLDARTLLHVASRRARDVLDPEFAIDVAIELGFADRYALARALADAARSVDDALNTGLHQARRMLPRRGLRRSMRRPLDLDVVDTGGEVTLSRNPNLDDPGLVLRVAAASSRSGLPVSAATWQRLQSVPPLPTPWQRAAASDFFAILAGRPHEVIREMDSHGLWTPLIPVWDNIRGAMPRERTHIHTIDQHTLATVARCAKATVHVSRPDLLLLGALFHDIGKNQGRPHEQVGAELVARQAAIMGLDRRDISCVQTLVAEHTTLARIAATMDPTSTQARDMLLDAVHYNPLTLELLEQLTEADALATGPTVWTHRLSRAVFSLCANAQQALAAMTETMPRQPIVAAPTPLGVRGNRVHWQGEYARESVRVLALLAAKGLKIEAARMVQQQGWRAEFDVRASIAQIDELEFVQAYKSGVFSMLPPVAPGMTATLWNGNMLEVRTVDRPGALGVLIGVLPDFRWINMHTPGDTMIAQCHLKPGFDRARVERDILAALVGWES